MKKEPSLNSITPQVLTFDCVYQQLLSPLKNKAYLVAYSGGLDSHVLLHLLASMREANPDICLRSVYVDHGLQKISAKWADHCKKITTSLSIDHQTLSLNLKIPQGESIEAVARKERYAAIAAHLYDEEVLLTAHHQDDQAETLLLQLFRGSGLDGLAAMPEKANFSVGLHMRPLLAHSREQLEHYARAHSLEYITDPSNKDNRYDRNYLRNEVIPLLKQRWPQMGQTISRSAKLHAEASELQAGYLEKELPVLLGSREGTLSAKALQQLPLIKQKAVLRHWIKKADFTAPSAAQLKHIIDDVLNSTLDAMPLVEWRHAEVRRYRDDVYIMSPLIALSMQTMSWNVNHMLTIDPSLPPLNPDDLGELVPVLLENNIPLSVRFREGGERIKLTNRAHSISLKNLFQEEKIPTWFRHRIPLVFADNQLIYIPGIAQVDVKDLAL